VAIQVKATEQYFPVVLLTVLYMVVLTFESVDEILKSDHSVKATEQYFPVVLFIMLYMVVLTYESVNLKFWCVTIQMKATDKQYLLSGFQLSPSRNQKEFFNNKHI